MDTVDAELERFISRRASSPNPDEEEESWKASVRKHNALVREENRAAWCDYHRQQAARHRGILEALVSYHERRAMELGEIGEACLQDQAGRLPR